eukprot:CAMPEP_0119409422 /NCGR_PEP_ID=MMETSP1335-20130426/2715_1 /TAXON_ID=259385 /ORGANISM="Chrysoculter rhomboideus, Strain RCC1486" /LENGTH=184 /DNA_ID=CAMNT_0007433795 /DNA_START=749 /DNA_END=1301 /DNA_ORIENTATION=-
MSVIGRARMARAPAWALEKAATRGARGDHGAPKFGLRRRQLPCMMPYGPLICIVPLFATAEAVGGAASKTDGSSTSSASCGCAPGARWEHRSPQTARSAARVCDVVHMITPACARHVPSPLWPFFELQCWHAQRAAAFSRGRTAGRRRGEGPAEVGRTVRDGWDDARGGCQRAHDRLQGSGGAW